MRRIIHNTTAIAACLSLLTPHIAMAQEEDPNLLKEQLEELVGQTKEGAEAEAAECAEAATDAERAAACAEPGPDAKPAADAPAEKPADSAETPAPEEKAAKPAEKPAKKSENKEPAKAEAQKAEAKKKAAEQKQAEQDKKQAEQQQAEQQQAEQKRKQAEQKQAEQKKKRAEQKEEARKKAAEEKEEAQKKAAEQNQEARKKQAEQEAQDDAKARDQEQAAANQSAGVRLANTEVGKQRANAMAGLHRVLVGEVESGLTTDQLKCLSGEGYPCPDGGLATTPKGVVLQPLKNNSFVLAASDQQMYRLAKDGELVERAAEEGAVETEAAREAANPTATDLVTALTSSGGQGEVVEQKVTEENSRSSSEDFSGSLRDALTGGQQAAESGDDDDDNDLTKALLLGLGAVAVGSMLSNNREVALSTPDRVVVTRADGSQEVIKDETALLREPGSTIATENFDDGSSRTVVTRANGSKVVTIRDADLRVLRRTLIDPDGTETVLIDDTAGVDPVDIDSLPNPAQPVPDSAGPMDEDELRAALRREADIGRRFTLAQIRNIPQVRALVAPVNIDAVTFETGSAAIKADQAQQLATLGNVIQEAISENPREIFLIEGHTDTVGSDAMNLALSDRRAESVALALSEYFDVPPENLVVQGYGEQYLKVRSEGDIRANRRASVRRITELLQTAAAQ